MVLAALMLLFPVPQNGDSPRANPSETVIVSDAPAGDSPSPKAATSDDAALPVSKASAKDSSLSASAVLPAMPEPKTRLAAPAAEPAPAGFPVSPVKPATAGSYSETPRQRKVWYTLAVVGHSGAAFDAWSTRRAISSGAGTEANPLLKPFAHSGALYVATQVSPAVMDFLGKRMMTSRYRLFRKMWWLPQAAGASTSFAAGAHNVGVVH